MDLAAFKGHAECVEALISQGASVTVKDNVTKRTPLHASGECALTLCLWYEPCNTYVVNFTHLLFPMHISSKKNEILMYIEDCFLFAEAQQLTLHLSFPCFFSSVPMDQSPSQNTVFFYTTTAQSLPTYLCFSIPLYYHLLFTMYDVSSTTPSFNGSSTKKKAGEDIMIVLLLLLRKKG